MSINDYLEKNVRAMNAQTGGAIGPGLISANSRQPAIREWVQEAIKRLSTLTVNLSVLADNVSPPLPRLKEATDSEGCDAITPTLTSDMGDLHREIGRIEHQVQRLSSAITG